MARTNECLGSAYLHGFSKILLMVFREIFEDRKFDHGVEEEEQEVFLDREMRGSISEAQGIVDNHTDTKGP